jgi:uncharacterized protein (DUF488 family)
MAVGGLMFTGYFAKIKSYPKGLRYISIARFNRYYSGETYIKLAPTPDMLSIESYEEYKALYYDRVLNKLDPIAVYKELGDNAVLLCYESFSDIKSGKKFCHRRIVAKWLEDNIEGLNVNEL